MLNIVVSCTYRKRGPYGGGRLSDEDSVLLRNCIAPRETRAAEWWKMLQASKHSAVPARELYAGEHWTTSLGLEDQAKRAGLQAQLWVCSAGYGLIPVDTKLKPYSATFSPGPDCVYRDDDAVTSPRAATAEWWSSLAKQGAGDKPRTLVDLYSVSSSAQLMVVASARYLQALSGEFQDGSLLDPERILLVSAGFNEPGSDLDELLLPADARLQSKVGGVMQALNARLASAAMGDLTKGKSFDELRKKYRRMLRRAPDRINLDRKQMSDDEICEFIQKKASQMLATDEKPTHTRLLRALRDGGNACEQKRFRELFKRLEAQLYA